MAEVTPPVITYKGPAELQPVVDQFRTTIAERAGVLAAAFGFIADTPADIDRIQRFRSADPEREAERWSMLEFATGFLATMADRDFSYDRPTERAISNDTRAAELLRIHANTTGERQRIASYLRRARILAVVVEREATFQQQASNTALSASGPHPRAA